MLILSFLHQNSQNDTKSKFANGCYVLYYSILYKWSAGCFKGNSLPLNKHIMKRVGLILLAVVMITLSGCFIIENPGVGHRHKTKVILVPVGHGHGRGNGHHGW